MPKNAHRSRGGLAAAATLICALAVLSLALLLPVPLACAGFAGTVIAAALLSRRQRSLGGRELAHVGA